MANTVNYLRPYLRGWPIIVGAMMLAFFVSNKYLNYTTPIYESTAKLRLADMNEGVPNSNLFKNLDVFATSQKINAEIELLKSHTLLTKALAKVPFEVQIFRSGSVRKTELFNNSPIIIKPINWSEKQKDRTYTITIHDKYKITVTAGNGEVYKGVLGDTLLIENAATLFQLNRELIESKKNLQIEGEYQFSVLSEAKLISQITSQLDIIAVDKDVPVIRINFKSSHPAKAAIFPNALAQVYIEDYIENKYGAANITVDFLDDRIDDISQKLGESEHMIQSYRDRNSITNITQETETDLRKISQLKIQQTNLKMSLEAIRDLENYVQSGKDNFLELAPNFEAFTDLLSTEIIKNIKQLQAEKKDLLLKYTKKDEKVLVVDAKIKDLTSYLIESISNTRKNLETKYDKLEADIAAAEEVFIDVPEKERMMTIMNRDFEIYNQSYNFLNQKKIEAEIAKAAKIAFHRVITPATVSKEPVSPNRAVIKIVSTILGMMGAIILIFMVHSLKGRVNNAATVEAQSMIPILASVPMLKSQTEREHFFIRTLSEWEVKGLLNDHYLINFTGFDKQHGVEFISKQMMDVMRLQKRHMLVIQLDKNIESNSNEFNERMIDEYTSQLHVSIHQLKSMTTKAWQSILKEKAQQYDYTILVNSEFGELHTMAGMAVADLNVVCFDTRHTAAKRIVEVDLMQQEYKIPNLFFALNRVGYNPSFIGEMVQWVLKIVKRIKRIKR